MLTRLTFLATALLIATAPAGAAEAPAMTGSWKGTVDSAVLVGKTPSRSCKTGKVTFANEGIDFTFEIKEQQGQRFGGTMVSARHSETLIGLLYPDNKGGMMLDDDGHYSFALTDPATMQVCYDHTKPSSKVIACWTATKAK